MNSERNLLLGLLACQNGFISQPQLLAAFAAWILNKSRGLDSHLVEQGALSGEETEVLERLVDLHLTRQLAAAILVLRPFIGASDPKPELDSFSQLEPGRRPNRRCGL